jgi:hypothetical protein
MTIKGISVLKEDNCLICFIDKFTHEIQQLIKNKLSGICHGIEQIDKDSFYSYENTIKRFYEVYKKKKEEHRKGLIGELLTHLLFGEILENFKIASVFFNKEERTIRKGFDLIFVNLEEKEHWYSEVKSGECNGIDVTAKSTGLLHAAKRDLKDKFDRTDDYLWNSLLTDLNSTFQDGPIKRKLKTLLKEDANNISHISSEDKKVIIVSVVYEPLTKKIDFERIKKLKKDIENENIFSKIMIFSIQKETYSKVESFLFKEFLT